MKAVLNNGVVFLSEPIATSRTVAVGFWFSVGSRYEKENQKGITHFVEHLLFKGTNPSKNCIRGRTAYDIACAFDRIGGYVNAFTERESCCVHFVVPYIHFSKALDIVCDMVTNSSFLEHNIEKERSVICSEILSAQDDPEEAALETLGEILLPNNAVSASITGSLKDIKNIKRHDLYNWYKKYFVNGRLHISIAGNFDYNVALSYIEKLPSRPVVNPGLQNNYTFKMPNWKSGMHFKIADFQMEQIFYAFPLKVPFSQNDYYCWAILNALIGDTMSSRLFQSLRENGGYCYNICSFFSIYDDCGFWCAYASSPSNKTSSVIQTLKAEFEKLKTEDFTEDEIQAAKEHICGEEIINADDVEQRMKKMSRQFSLGFEMVSTEKTGDQIRAITKEQLRFVLNNLLATEKQSILIYGPKIGYLQKKKM